MIQTRIDAGERPGIIWQVWAFVILTAGETLVSPTHLEFSYTQGPIKLKSLVMCTYLFAVSLGNQFTAAVNFFIQNPDGTVKLQGTSYFMFFVWVMLEYRSAVCHRHSVLQRPYLLAGPSGCSACG